MKKTLIALAALAAFGTVSAQSSVTISGRIDLGHANQTTKSTVDGKTTETNVMSFAGEQQGRTTSRLTFAGTEDLGGGLKASFNYETRLNPDNTTAAGLDRTRNMFLNLSSGLGSITIGTYLNSFDSLRGFSAATYSAPGGDFLANHQNVIGTLVSVSGVTDTELADSVGISGTVAQKAAGVASLKTLFSNGLSSRSTNSVGYRSPSYAGFTFSAGFSKDNTDTDFDGTNIATAKTMGILGSVAYSAGPLNAQLTIGRGDAELRTSTLAKSSSESNDSGFAVSYDLGVATPYVQYERTSVELTSFDGVAQSDKLKTKAIEVGSKFPMGSFTPYITLGKGDISMDDAEFKTESFQVGTTYDLSKRTYLYAAAGNFKLSLNDLTSKTTGYKAGLVHSF